jgi:hypothetical protein
VARINRTITDRLQGPGATRATMDPVLADFPRIRLAPAPSMEHNFDRYLISFVCQSGAAKSGAARSLRNV